MNRLIQFKSSRWPAMLLAIVVAIITCLAVANATQTITTPNAAFISYNLVPGAFSAAITPASSKSVLVMGCCTTGGDQSVGQVSLIRIPSTTIGWVGSESYLPAAITAGIANAAGVHIVYIDLNHHVDILTASSDTIRVQNHATSPRAGNVTLVW